MTLRDATVCPLCCGTVTEGHFCDDCTREIEATPLGHLPMVGMHLKHATAVAILLRNRQAIGKAWDFGRDVARREMERKG